MKKYYKGRIIFSNELNSKTYDIAFWYNKILNCSDKEFFDKFNLLNQKEQQIIINFLMENNSDNIIIPDIIKNIFNKLFSENKISYYRCHEQIIYEMIVSQNNDCFAKEIITGNIFPIVKINNINLDYEITKEKELECFINHDDESDGLIGQVFSDHLFISSNHDRYYFGKDPYDSWLYHIEKMSTDKKFYDHTKKYFKTIIDMFKLNIVKSLNFSNLLRCEVFIDHDMIANQSEIDFYLRRYKNVFGNKKNRKKFIDNLNYYANQNVFKEEIIPKKDDIKVLMVDDVTKIMERIELGLLKLKNYNESEYNELNNEYQNLLNNQEDILKIPLTKSYLESLEAKILFCLKFDKNNGGNIINYLNYQKELYLNNFINGGESILTISDIDNLMELYLKMQKEFDIKSKRNIIRNISLLYLFELYENKDNLDKYNLNNSYINECLISIVLCLNTLLELNIIKTDYIIDVNNDYTIEDILKIISNMEFKLDNEKVKVLR